MEIRDLLNKCDHTVLNRDTTWADVKQVIDDAIKYNVASVCIPPYFVKQAKEYAMDKMPICTVVGFPNGYGTTASKVFETQDAINNGADEIDAVINVGEIKANNYQNILDEIKRLKEVCGNRILKIIIETCLLTDEEIVKMCEVVHSGGADFIKTSTGFSTLGAKREQVALMKANAQGGLKIKAAGGIRTVEDGMDFVRLGADRIGTSAIVKSIKNSEQGGKL